MIINIIKYSRHKKNTISYFFVGNQDNILKEILNNIENNKELDEKDNLILNESFEQYIIEEWMKSKYSIKFIYDSIYNDDTIKIIKKKIFYYFSDIKNKKYVLPNNQLLWLKNNNNYQYLGFYYNNYVPNILDKSKKITSDNEFLEDKPYLKNNNNMLIIDLLSKFYGNITNFNNTIYLYDAYDDLLFIKEKKKKVNEKLYDGYFKKFYPHYNFDFNYVKINIDYNIVKNIILKNEYIHSLINNTKIDKNKYSELYITNTNLIINGGNVEEKININLYELFYIITQNLSIEMPFVKYNDIEFNNPISVLNKDIINSIDMKILKVWLGIKKKEFTLYNYTKGLYFKRLINSNNKINFSTIEIPIQNNYKDTLIFLKCNFKDSDKTTLNDIKDIVNNLGELIKIINKNTNNYNISLPYIDIVNNKVLLSDNIKFSFLNSVIHYDLGSKINFKKLKEICSYFSQYIDIINTNEINILRCKYKKISNYVQIEDLFNTIVKLIKQDKNEIEILKQLQIDFDISLIYAKELYIKWQKLKNSDDIKKIGININIIITNNIIKIDGILNLQ